MPISRAAASPGTISVKRSTSCSATYLLLTAVRRPPPLEVEVAPVSASQLLKKGVYPLSRSAVATCISCARVAIPVSWSMMAKPLPGQHAGDEVLLVRTGRRSLVPPECVPEGAVWRDEAVGQVPREEP